MTSFLDLASHRRSIRKYTDEPIKDDDIKKIMQAALMSPASKRCNPWEFVVVTDSSVLRNMSGCRTYGSAMLAEAAAAIVVCVDASLTDTWQCDGAIAAQQMLLEAADIGLGACWVQVYGRMVKDISTASAENMSAEQLIRELCNIPERLQVLCIVSLGHPDEERKPRELDKLQYEKIHYGQY